MNRGRTQLPCVHLSTPESSRTRLIRDVQSVILTHPVATQAAFRALIREGRKYLETEAGRQLGARLASSALVHDARTAWELSGGWLVDEEPESILPSAYLDLILGAIGEQELP